MHKNIKILVGYHKPSYLFKDDIFVPIHCGRAVSNIISKDGYASNKDAQWLLANTIGDDTGDNISAKNREYCECTALYWAWKNYDKLGNPDYIGFMQYRRQFILNDDSFKNKILDQEEKAYATRKIEYPCKDYDSFLGIDKENLIHVLEEFGGVCTSPCELSLVDVKNLRDDYAIKIPGVNVDDFDLMVDVVTKMYPNMADYINARVALPQKSCFQMWILPKKIFFDYMEFLFTVLFECEKNIDVSSYSVNGKRTMGYLAELLCDFYMNFYKDKYQLKDVNVCQIQNCYPYDKIKKRYAFAYLYNYIKYMLLTLFCSKSEKSIFKEKKKNFKRQFKLSLTRKH